jgi:hypothetical protein
MGTTFSNNRTFPAQSQGYNYHADPTFTPNSNFALQANAPLSTDISATAQIVARGDNDFQPTFHWAYLKYQFNDTFALKAGRLQLPLYQYSDYSLVGEAYPWVVPPEAVYAAQATNYDGLNLSMEKNIGNWYLFLQAIYGGFKYDITLPSATSTGGTVNTSITVNDQNLTGFTLDTSYDEWLTLRTAVFVEKLSISGDGNPANPITALEAAASSLASQGYTDAAKALSTSDDPFVYYTVSAQITHSNWLFITEYQGLQNIAGANGSSQISSEYASLGYHFGKLMPIVTFGHRNEWTRANKMKSSTPPGATVTVPFNGQPITLPADFFYDSIAANPQTRGKDYFYEIGLRYDLTNTVALKLDYTFYESHYDKTDYGLAAVTYTNPQDANRLLAAITFSF